jgi:hypothetical protein
MDIPAGAPLVHDMHPPLRWEPPRLAGLPDPSAADVRAQGRPLAMPAGTPGPTAGQARGPTIPNDLGANRPADVLPPVQGGW